VVRKSLLSHVPVVTMALRAVVRAGGAQRAAVALLLVLGVLGMHTIVLDHGSSHAVASVSAQQEATGPAAALQVADADLGSSAAAARTVESALSQCHDGCTGHGGHLWHMCLAMLTVGLVLAVLALQRRRTLQAVERCSETWAALVIATELRQRLSLSQLCVLRT
jgi:hypothetical protein